VDDRRLAFGLCRSDSTWDGFFGTRGPTCPSSLPTQKYSLGPSLTRIIKPVPPVTSHHVAETAGTGHGRRSTEAGGEGLGEERAHVSDPMQSRTLPTHGRSAHKAGTFAPLHAAEGASPEPRASASVLGCLTALDYPLHGGDGGKGAVVKHWAGAIKVRACVRACVHSCTRLYLAQMVASVAGEQKTSVRPVQPACLHRV
jgi:hypothetical protein